MTAPPAARLPAAPTLGSRRHVDRGVAVSVLSHHHARPLRGGGV
jgi:hypothetical protein